LSQGGNNTVAKGSKPLGVQETDRSSSRKKPISLGKHLLIEMHGCLSGKLDDVEWVEKVLVEAAKRAQATIVNVAFHKFNPIGVSGVVVIAESHLAIHTWPEYDYAAVDIFSCGKRFKGSEAASFIVKQFRCNSPSVVELERGLFSPGAASRALPLPFAV
jgi:S-adenosylmethionine decarboxylase